MTKQKDQTPQADLVEVFTLSTSMLSVARNLNWIKKTLLIDQKNSSPTIGMLTIDEIEQAVYQMRISFADFYDMMEVRPFQPIDWKRFPEWVEPQGVRESISSIIQDLQEIIVILDKSTMMSVQRQILLNARASVYEMSRVISKALTDYGMEDEEDSFKSLLDWLRQREKTGWSPLTDESQRWTIK